jgi:iron complex transport system substrate-binding protein
MDTYPRRIVCLTEETTETLYLLGEGARVVGVSGYTVRPPEARQKPRISAFISARYDKIDALAPDLILGFSDLQADIAAALVKRGYNVVIFNQRSIAEILQMIRIVGGLVGRQESAEVLAARLEDGVNDARRAAEALPFRLRVFFEEWDEPLISGIQWVEELVEVAGGIPIFPELRGAKMARDRIVDAAEVARRNPHVVLASWCGKAVRAERIVGRAGWQDVAAVQRQHVYEIKSPLILQPGPAALTDGLSRIRHVLTAAAADYVALGIAAPSA